MWYDRLVYSENDFASLYYSVRCCNFLSSIVGEIYLEIHLPRNKLKDNVLGIIAIIN